MGIWISSVTGWVADLVNGGAAGRGRPTAFVIDRGGAPGIPTRDADGMLGEPGDAGSSHEATPSR